MKAVLSWISGVSFPPSFQVLLFSLSFNGVTSINDLFSSKNVDFWLHSPTCLHPCQLPSNDASEHLCNAASAHHVSFFQTSVQRRRKLLVVYRLAFWQHDQPIEADFWPTWPRHIPYWLTSPTKRITSDPMKHRGVTIGKNPGCPAV